ncbi:MAG: hypothetical protein J3Q66DRAFT_332457, partial [Benniella sp.]
MHHHAKLFFQPSASTTEFSTGTQIVDPLAIAEANSINSSLSGYSTDTIQNAQSIVLAQNQSLNHSPQDLMSGQAAIVQLNQRFDRFQVEADRNKNFQGQLLQMQQQLGMNQQEMIRMQQEMLRMQQKALDRLAIIQSRVQALVTQTYELHEYPIPRLFIVLPKTLGLSGKLKSFFSDQFRLYFLCECGTHTMSEDSATPHHIHLAKHDGYGLEKPSAFFERFGSYVLTVMNMIKYGITAAGLVVPSLASSGIVNGIDTAQKHMDYIKKNIGPLVDDTIKFLDGIKRDNEFGAELTEDHKDHSEFDRLEALEGADLRQLESYLKVKDQGRALGNLYRIVTSEGHVKWVCFDHYRATYRETAIKRLKEIIDANQGIYVEETGRIEITITSKTLAIEFYDAMVKARWIQELEITLKWDATMDDLREFANAVAKANVVSLTVDGTFFKRPALDVVNRTRRFNPIMKLASNSRIQSFRIQGFEDFFSRINKSSLAPAPKLRALSLQLELPLQDKADFLDNLFEQYSALKALDVKLHQGALITKTVLDIFNKLPQLQSLKIDRGTNSFTSSLAKDMKQAVILTVDHLNHLTPDDFKFIQDGCSTKLMIKYVPQDGDGERLLSILHPSEFCCVRVIHKGTRSLVAATLEWRLHELVGLITSEFSEELVSLSIDRERLSLTAGFSQGRIQNMTMIVKRLDNLDPDDLTYIQQGHLTRLVVKRIPMKGDKDRLTNILRHNQRLSHLRFTYGKEDDPDATLEMGLLDLMTVISSNTSSELRSLSVDCQGLSLTAGFSQGRVQNMTMIIERLNSLNPDDLTYIQQGHLTELVMKRNLMQADKDRLTDILRDNQSLSHLEFRYGDRNGPLTGNTPEMRLPGLVSVVTSAPCTLDSFQIDYEELKMTASVLHGKAQDVFVTIKRLGGLHSDDISFIEQGCLSRLQIEDTPREKDRDRLAQILQHNPGLVHLQIGHNGEHSNVINSDPRMKLRDLAMLATSDTLFKIESLEISDGNLSFTPDIAQGKINDVGMTINRIETFSPDDFKFIREYHITKLAIKHTPLEADENQLTDILHQLPTLSHLQVGCRGKRSFAIVNLIIAIRDNIIQERGSCGLRTFELMAESMVPFDILDRTYDDTRIYSHLSFYDGSKEFDMRTWIRLKSGFSDAEPVKDFVCRYGWSIV